MVTARTHMTTKMSDAVLNSGMVGLGDGDADGVAVEVAVGVGEVIVFEVLITETVCAVKICYVDVFAVGRNSHTKRIVKTSYWYPLPCSWLCL